MCGSILRAISKARRHQSDTECSVRGEWFTGLEGVSTRPWKANSKAKLSIPSISQLSALTGVTRSNSCSFCLLCRICLQQQQQQKWGVRERNQLAKTGFSLVRKMAVFRHFWGTHQCGDTSVRWNETLYSIKQLWGMHKLEEQCQAHSQLMFWTTTLHDRRVTTGLGVLRREPDLQINKGSSWWKYSRKGRDQEERLVQPRLTAVDSRRNRIFSGEDFLTASQIAGFSSRLFF